jgi:predicted nucleotidyltransferase
VLAAEFDPKPVLELLVRHGVDFVLIGGLAGIVHGSAYNTQDLDVAYARERGNLERLAAALHELGATLRGAPPGLPDAETLAAGLNFTFATEFGSVDILGEPQGAPRYDELRAAGTDELVSGVRVRVASLDHLIAMKEAAGRPKDKLMASEYRVIADELRAPKDGA